ncbi:MAG: coproporphyrinogen III oxidase family protein [Bacteroidetes bacterium]|nr:MAG: coproporphyrinogen III oxidase family protein [Bacteroidota bacterium]REK04749.1 MAG: coproporphyrinogen III oxidase family protein [Bacteroidota bacterium]REK36223.1 MAG: coproporphyrinogen III oxidase family protein [Bacteroidota bacterium]REK51115.1 MAG: coproporphyrinogen III oxidase family protein [Bacteroidota bacterium]
MAGLYIHIPFCRQACHYCDFHFSTTLGTRGEMADAIVKELVLRKDYLEQEKIETVYFGGGTPSLLDETELNKIMSAVYKNFDVSKDSEITLEANPDDLTEQKIINLHKSGVNRLSIGIQSFLEEDLVFMNRSHNAAQAIDSVKASQDKGFENISIDLIYGIPGRSESDWKLNLNTAFELNVPHLSCYALTVEKGTALAHMIAKNKTASPDDEQQSEQFHVLMHEARTAGFEHYEISNFAKAGFRSRHNSLYWSGKKYLGIGPSAHSYNLSSRQWNVSSNQQYIRSLKNSELPAEIELLDDKTKFNEFVLTRIRTIEGINLKDVELAHGKQRAEFLMKSVNDYPVKEHLSLHENIIKLSDEGKFFADRIAADLFQD